MEDDYVWIHDYHLLVLPSLLRKKFNKMRCGLFLHSPFPSSEIFRTFPRRDELIRSMLNADLIGAPPPRPPPPLPIMKDNTNLQANLPLSAPQPFLSALYSALQCGKYDHLQEP